MSVYGLIACISIQDTLEYRVNFLLNTVKYSLMIAFTAMVWLAVEQASPTTSYSRSETITYFLGAALLYSLTNFHPYEIEVDIKQGGLSRFLVKPISPHWFYATKLAAEAGIATIIKALIFVPAVLLLGVSFSAHPSQLFLFCCYLPVIYYISYLLLGTISVGAFWFTEIYAVRWGLTIIFRLLSGVLVPIDYFPTFAQKFLIYTPFPHLVATPVRLLQGMISPAEGLFGLLVLLLWGSFLHVCNAQLWKLGTLEYESTGI